MTLENRSVIVTRPEPDATRFGEALRRAGLAPILAPLLSIRVLPGPALDEGARVAFTSANGVRAVRAPRQGIAFAVGEATAAAARASGWETVFASGGDVAALSSTISDEYARGAFEGPILHIAGSDRAGDLVAMLSARGVPALRRVAYDAAAAKRLSPEVEAALGAGASATFFSARTARVFMDLIGRQDAAGGLAAASAVALSAAAAEPLRAGHWRRIGVARRPDAEAVIEALLAH